MNQSNEKNIVASYDKMPFCHQLNYLAHKVTGANLSKCARNFTS